MIFAKKYDFSTSETGTLLHLHCMPSKLVSKQCLSMKKTIKTKNILNSELYYPVASYAKSCIKHVIIIFIKIKFHIRHSTIKWL